MHSPKRLKLEEEIAKAKVKASLLAAKSDNHETKQPASSASSGKQYGNKGLPTFEHRQRFLDLVQQNQLLVVTGDTVGVHTLTGVHVLISVAAQGSGKSTQLAQFLYGAGYADSGIIAVTQPRRIGAVSGKGQQQRIPCWAMLTKSRCPFDSVQTRG